MQIVVNGVEKEVRESLSAQTLLVELGLHQQRLAVEVNQELVVRSKLEHYELKAGDRVEIIHAIGGG